MTREEMDFIGGMNTCDEISNEAYKKIMCHCEELEQEPCDAISREKVLEIFKDVHPLDYNANAYKTKIENLPPVYPKAKVGKWIYHQSCGYNEIIDEWYECSECGRGFSAMSTSKENILKDYPYCHCGAKMESEE